MNNIEAIAFAIGKLGRLTPADAGYEDAQDAIEALFCVGNALVAQQTVTEDIAIIDGITRELTGRSFAALMATHESYTPTIRASDGWRETLLADAFDRAAAARGQSRRAWRG